MAVKNISRNGTPKVGDIGINEKYETLIFLRPAHQKWTKYKHDPNQYRYYYYNDILKTLTENNQWFTPSQLGDNVGAIRNTLEQLEWEGRIYKGEGDLYGNLKVFKEWISNN